MAYIIKDGKAIQVVTNDIKIPKNIIDKVDNNMHISELPDSDAGVVPDTFAMRFSRV